VNYSSEDIKQGLSLKRQAQETPSNFGLLDGSVERPSDEDFGKSRMAGPVGDRAMQMMNDPNERARTDNWMSSFGLSNQGYEFNQARMMMANPAPPEEQQ